MYHQLKYSQFNYVKQCVTQSVDIYDMYLECIQTLDRNEYENMSGLYNIALFDMMNICVVYNNHALVDKIYVPKEDVTLISHITKTSQTAIIVTQ